MRLRRHMQKSMDRIEAIDRFFSESLSGISIFHDGKMGKEACMVAERNLPSFMSVLMTRFRLFTTRRVMNGNGKPLSLRAAYLNTFSKLQKTVRLISSSWRPRVIKDFWMLFVAARPSECYGKLPVPSLRFRLGRIGGLKGEAKIKGTSKNRPFP